MTVSIHRTDEYYASQTPFYGPNGSNTVDGYYTNLDGYYDKALDLDGLELTNTQEWSGDGTSNPVTIENGGCLPTRYELWSITAFGGMKNTIRMFSPTHVTETTESTGLDNPATLVTALTPLGVWNIGVNYLLKYRPATIPETEV